MPAFIDMTGQRFGRLTVVKLLTPTGTKHHKWLCKCDCGNECVTTRDNLKRGTTKSCGCLRKETVVHNVKSRARKITYTHFDDYVVGDDGCGHSFTVDEEDFEFIKTKHWVFTDPYWITSERHGNKWKNKFMHTYLLKVRSGNVIDHKDRNGSNNRKSNLREATVSQNAINSKTRKNSSGFTGVWFHKESQFWCASVVINQKSIWLGEYKNKDDAIKARLKAEAKYFSEFAPQRHLFEQYGIEVDNEE